MEKKRVESINFDYFYHCKQSSSKKSNSHTLRVIPVASAAHTLKLAVPRAAFLSTYNIYCVNFAFEIREQ